MAIARIVRNLRRLAIGDVTALGKLRGRAPISPPGQVNRLVALEKAIEVQAALNETVTFQLKVVCDLLEKSQKRLFVMTIGLIATATVAAVALAAAILS